MNLYRGLAKYGHPGGELSPVDLKTSSDGGDLLHLVMMILELLELIEFSEHY